MELVLPERDADWSDAHEGPVRADIRTAREAYEMAFRHMPRWANWAMAARNLVVKPLGLKTEPEDIAATPDISGSMDMMTALPVLQETREKYEVGLTDRHLTFTLLTELNPGHARVTTRIWFNHWTGRLYLSIVLIPHKLIVRSALRGLAQGHDQGGKP